MVMVSKPQPVAVVRLMMRLKEMRTEASEDELVVRAELKVE